MSLVAVMRDLPPPPRPHPRGRRYKVKPTHCVRCDRPLTPSNVRQKRYVCKSCDGVRRGRIPEYHGLCLAGCGRRGNRRSGLCSLCYGNITNKRRRREKLLTKTLGEFLPFEWLLKFPDDPRAKDYVRRMLLAIHEGQLSLVHHPYPSWRWQQYAERTKLAGRA